MRTIATDRDNVVVEARRIEAEAAAALAAPVPTEDVIGGDVFANLPSGDESRD
jgi:DNA-directed RNA polymerase subunit beta'